MVQQLPTTSIFFKVAVNGNFSDEKRLTYSIPQCSCSGANLFNLYCSMLNDVVPLDLHLKWIHR